MKRYIIGLLAGTAIFFSGYWLHKPKVITIEKIKEVKVYDFSQDQKMMEIYANTMGKTLENKKDIEEYRHKIWTEAYQEGYKAGFLQR